MNTSIEDKNLNRKEESHLGILNPNDNPAEIKLKVREAIYSGKDVFYTMDGDQMDDDTHHAILEGDVLKCKEIDPTFWKSLNSLEDICGTVIIEAKGIWYIGFLIYSDFTKHVIKLEPCNPKCEIEFIKVSDIQKICKVVYSIRDFGHEF